MASLRELRRKVKSVKSTQQITRAMKMVAAARLNKAQERIMLARPYAQKIEHLLEEVATLNRHANADVPFHHPFLEKRESRRIDVLVVTADRGLCGGFNAAVVRKTVQFLKDHADGDVHLWVIGKKGRDYFRRYRIPIEKEYMNFFSRLSFAQADILGKDLTEAFLATGTREIAVIYNEFKSRLQSQLIVKTLIPVADIPDVKPAQDFLYEPSKEKLLEELFPAYFKNQLFRILLESQSAELAARMTAMDNATTNASDLISSLTLTMNKVRQAGITKEILEIVGGAEALQAG